MDYAEFTTLLEYTKPFRSVGRLARFVHSSGNLVLEQVDDLASKTRRNGDVGECPGNVRHSGDDVRCEVVFL